MLQRHVSHRSTEPSADSHSSACSHCRGAPWCSVVATSRRAPPLPVLVLLELARLAWLTDRCSASAERRGRLSGRLKAACNRGVPPNTRAAAAREPSLDGAVCRLSLVCVLSLPWCSVVAATRCAPPLPVVVLLGLARLAWLADRCSASAGSHGRLSGRLAAACNSGVPPNTRAAAAREPSLDAAVCILSLPWCSVVLRGGDDTACSIGAGARVA